MRFDSEVGSPSRCTNAAYLELQRSLESGAVSYPRKIPIAIRHAKNEMVTDMDGREYIDFLTGAGVLPLGHNPSFLVEIAKKQLDTITHGLDFPTEAKLDFMEQHLSMLPEKLQGKYKMHFCGPTGADAVEAAIKLAKLNTQGGEVVSFLGGYHGCTQGALSLTTDRKLKEGVQNLIPGVHYFPFSYCYSCPFGLEQASCGNTCASYFGRVMGDSHNGMGKIAAVILECVQGEGGVIPVKPALIEEIHRYTQKHKIPLIVDEVQTGCGRTGNWFAFEEYGIEPDIIVMSKAISGIGAPCAFILYKKHLDTWPAGKHIGTFRGNNMAFATGAEFVRYAKRSDLLENVRERGFELMQALKELGASHGFVGDVRGKGLMLGVEIIVPGSRRRSPKIARLLQQYLVESGLIVELGGRDSSTIRLLPPLNISAESVRRAIDIIESVFLRVDAEHHQNAINYETCDYAI